MKLVGSGNQSAEHYFYRADSTITTGGTAQLILGRAQSRSHFFIQNISTGVMYVEIGTGAAHATLTGNVVTSVTVDNAGFGFSHAPLVRFLGGGYAGNSSYTGLAQPGGAAPDTGAGSPAKARCIMTGSAPNMSISSIIVDYGGTGYAIAPYVQILNSDLDPNGAAVPSSGVGIQLAANGGSIYYNGTTCPTDPIAIWGATTSQAFLCRWMD